MKVYMKGYVKIKRLGARKVCDKALIRLRQEGKNNTEIAKLLNVSQSCIHNFIQRSIPDEEYRDKMDGICDSYSDMDSLPGVDGRKLIDRLYLRQALEEVLIKIRPQEDFVLRCRFGLDGDFYTLQEIADIMGLTRERIRQIERRGICRIREFHVSALTQDRQREGE